MNDLILAGYVQLLSHVSTFLFDMQVLSVHSEMAVKCDLRPISLRLVSFFDAFHMKIFKKMAEYFECAQTDGIGH